MFSTRFLPGAADIPVRRVLILKADRQAIARLAGVTAAVFPHAEIVVTQFVEHAAAALAQTAFDLLITGFRMMDGDTCGLIAECASAPRRAKRILVVTGRRNPWVSKLLQELPIDGAFDTRAEAPEELAAAMRSVMLNRRCFSESFLCFPWAESLPFPDIFGLLTDAEVLTLAVVGDGCDRKTVAFRLDLTLNTINSTCDELHRKLNVHHDRELMQIAALAGLVNLEFPNVIRLGFEILVERYEQAQKRKRQRPAFIAALCACRVSCRRASPADATKPFGKAS